MAEAREHFVPVPGAELFVRELSTAGRTDPASAATGPPLVVLHGGPDFGHDYLRPELDLLAGVARLVYYDQRGRGRSTRGVRPEDVTIASEIDDLDRLRVSLGLERMALLGHSWGALLAGEYALRHAARLSHLVFLDPAPLSRADRDLFRAHRAAGWPDDLDELARRGAEPAFRAGDPDAVAAYYRVHYRGTVTQPALLDRLIGRMRAVFTREGILLGRAIEDRLVDETWLAAGGYDLLPGLSRLSVPAFVVHGAEDFVPVACAEHIARAITGARLVVLPGCGHFASLEQPEAVREVIARFLGAPAGSVARGAEASRAAGAG